LVALVFDLAAAGVVRRAERERDEFVHDRPHSSL
jgi:hypothetical protein